MFAAALIALYFVLNLLVTVTNKTIIQHTSSPYLLTAFHTTASFVSTSVIAHCQSAAVHARFATTQRISLILFSALFTINITFSNFTLGLVSLPIHQTIRALAPILTIIISVTLQLKTWSSYNLNTYMSLLPIIMGVVIATYSQDWGGSSFGIVMTLLGAVTAVLKTIATHSLQADLGIRSYELIRITSPLAVMQSLAAAWYYNEFTTIERQVTHAHHQLGHGSSYTTLVSLILSNALLAAALNLTSFEANRRWGALSMGVAANLKQVAILFLPDGSRLGKVVRPSSNVVVGSLMTVGGGLWYAVAQKRQADIEKIDKHMTGKLADKKYVEIV